MTHHFDLLALAGELAGSHPWALPILKISLLLAVGWILHGLLRARNPRWRILLWRGAAVGTLVIAFLAFIEPLVSLNWLPAAPQAEIASSPPPQMFENPPIEPMRPLPEPPAYSPPAVLPRDAAPMASPVAPMESKVALVAEDWPVGVWLIGIWSGGFVVLGLRTLVAVLRLSGIRRRATQIPEWLHADANALLAGTHRITVCHSAQIPAPCSVGIFRPLILLPKALCHERHREELRAAIAHEAAHFSGRDLIWNWILHVMTLVGWFHPLAWRIRLMHADACDERCDAEAAQRLGDTADYTRSLARIALSIHPTQTPMVMTMARQSTSRRRIELSKTCLGAVRLSPRRVGVAAILAGLTVFIVGTMALAPSSAEVAKATADALPTPAIAVIDRDQPFAVVAMRQLRSSLKARELPFVEPAHIGYFGRHLYDYLDSRVKSNILDAQKRIATDAIETWASQIPPTSEGYLQLGGDFNMLCWQLWTFAEREKLSPEELERREAQREWMREYIRKLPLPDTAKTFLHLRHASQVQRLETELFENPLNPFFHTPMSNEEFKDFQRRLLKRQGNSADRLIYAVGHIFYATVFARTSILQQEFPPGFQTNGLSVTNTNRFHFQSASPENAMGNLGSWPISNTIDVDMFVRRQPRAILTDGMPDGEDDLHFFPDQGKLRVAGNARMAAINKTEWFRLDQIPTDDLRRLVKEHSVPFIDIPSAEEFRNNPGQINQQLNTFPTIALITDNDNLTLIRIKNFQGDEIVAQFRPRPLMPYPPFHEGEIEFESASTSRISAVAPHNAMLWFHSDKHVHFVIYHKGFLQTGISYSQRDFTTERYPVLWDFGGKLNAFSGKKEIIEGRRQWEHQQTHQLEFRYSPPTLSLTLNGKPYDLSEGQVIALTQQGEPVQLNIPVVGPEIKGDPDAINHFVQRIETALGSAPHSKTEEDPLEKALVPPDGASE